MEKKNINSICLRYVVPFMIEESFDEALRKIESQKIERHSRKDDKKTELLLWEKRVASLDGPESDLYDYVRNEFRSDDSRTNEKKIGFEWIFRGSEESSAPFKESKKIKDLRYFSDAILPQDNSDKDKEYKIQVSNVGLYVFRNKLGLLWYELKIEENRVDQSWLITFQNIVRELNREGTAHFWEFQKKGKDQQYYDPFSFGNWISDMLGFMNVKFLAERKNSYIRMRSNSMKGDINRETENRTEEEVNKTVSEKSPDKAILFTYVSFEEGTSYEKCPFVYHLTNGYTESYHFSEETAQDMKKPFADVIWYATQEGVAYVAWPSKDNRETFISTISSKIRTDYFALYIKTLYQSFSLLLYADRIQKEIYADHKQYLEGPVENEVSELFSEINLFLTKSMATTVSHIHHQSEFYVYLKNQLRIHEDVKSVTSGLNALDSLQREQRDQELQLDKEKSEKRERKRDGKIQAIMGLFAMLGISSALVDTFDFIYKFQGEGDWSKLSVWSRILEMFWMEVVGLIGFVAMIFAVKAIYDAFVTEKEREVK